MDTGSHNPLLRPQNKPKVKQGHVVIVVKASSLNPVDHKILKGKVRINPVLPGILHMDVAGVIIEVGEEVTAFKKGDEIYGCAGGLQGEAGNIDGALAASVFHSGKIPIPDLKAFLRAQSIEVRV